MVSIVKQILPFLIIQCINGQPSAFPPYSQQCQDDAGPPFLDDGETFPGKLYHTGSPAYPMLKEDGTCAKPLEKACFERGDKKTAYLEGPIDCGGNGWYCRILEDPNWDQINLVGDFNFSPCNVTEFGDFYGHCHGSSDESTYYWWLRDHWYRQYNGRLRCCCDWGRGEDPLTGGGFTDRCDYRRVVTRDENVENCRDANEDHNLSWEGGCDADRLQEQLNKPLPENEELCWEVQRFGEPREGNDDDFTQPPTIVTGPTPSPSKDVTPTGRPTNTVEPTSDGDNPTPAPTTEPTNGPTPTSTPPPTPSNSNTLLMSTLDNKMSVRNPSKGFGKGQTNLDMSDFVVGKDAKGANFSEDGNYIRFKAAIKRRGKSVKKNINLKNGAITFWYKPSYSYSSSAGDEEDKVLVSVGKPGKEKMILGMSESLYFAIRNGEYETVVEDEDLWTAGQWVFIKITWNRNSQTNSIKIFVNNERVDSNNVEGGWKLGSEKKAGHIYVGSMNREGESPANGIIDSFKVYKTSNV